MDGILASIFLGFWSILGAKLGGKPEPRSTQKGIEKRCKKEEQRDCQKSRNKNLQPRAPPRVLGPGEGVGGGVNPSPREEGKGMRPVQRAKPPQPRGLVGFYIPGNPTFISPPQPPRIRKHKCTYIYNLIPPAPGLRWFRVVYW